VIKAKYYPNTSFWKANHNGTKFVFWSSILQVKDHLQYNVQYQLHAGNSSIWSTPWCSIWDSIHDHLRLPVTVTPLPAKAYDLWVPNTHDWNIPLLSNIFYDAATQTITATQSIPSDQQDILRWTSSTTGKCSTKEIYKLLSSTNTVQLPQQGPRSISTNAAHILRRAWRTKKTPSPQNIHMEAH
jgi:hypothetical protein